jgi:hypothetical protein
MAKEKVQVDWIKDQVFLLQDRDQFPIVMAQPNGVNGDSRSVAGHIRGVDVFRFQDGKISEKFSYVKG